MADTHVHVHELDQLAEELTLHREVDESGIIRYRNEMGQFHRLNGPAIIYDSDIEHWIQNGRHHRLDGPAVIRAYSRYWFIDGKEYTEDEFNAHPDVIAYAKSKSKRT